MCDLYDGAASGRGSALPALYAHVPRRLHRRLAAALAHLSLVHGTRRRRAHQLVPPDHLGAPTIEPVRLSQNWESNSPKPGVHERSLLFNQIDYTSSRRCASCFIPQLAPNWYNLELKPVTLP